MDQELAFQDLISSAHAAIYAYGVVAALTDQQEVALDDMAIHRRKRDELIQLATAIKIPIPPAAIAYELPLLVNTPASANACAATIEEQLCAHWSQATFYLPAEIKAAAVTFSQSCAQRAFAWSGVSKAFYS